MKTLVEELLMLIDRKQIINQETDLKQIIFLPNNSEIRRI